MQRMQPSWRPSRASVRPTGSSYVRIRRSQTSEPRERMAPIATAGPAAYILCPVPHAGILRIDYEFFSIPDTLDVYYEDVDIFSSGWVQRSGQFDIPYGPGNSTNLT